MHIVGEHYHIYNRGAHKAPIFLDKNDYERFVSLLFTANDASPRRIDLRRINYRDMFAYARDPLVDIYAYCLMPNHFHIGLNEIREKGVERFMRKLCTAYAMYYNGKYGHSGTIFQGEYKSKRVENDEQLRYLVQYIHLNPSGDEESDPTKTAKPERLKKAMEHSRKYEYSSLRDYLEEYRSRSAIITRKIPGV